MLEKKRYYVYLHRRASDKVVFYIGKGTGIRAYARSRTKAWKDFIKDEPYEVIFEAINLTNSQAIDIESQLIRNPREDWQLVNQKRSSKDKVINFDEVNKYLYYDETSPSCLRWKLDVGKRNTVAFKSAGDVAGSYHPKRNRYLVTLNGTIYIAHRVVVTLHGITIPDNYHVNHKDCNSNNNKISNLEVVPPSVNSQLKTDYVYSKSNLGILIEDTKYGKVVRARFVDVTGKRVQKSITTHSEEELKIACEKLVAWRNEQIEDKVRILKSCEENLIEQS
jgi:hypothetical protein